MTEKQDFIQRTQKFWSPYYNRAISDDEAVEIIQNTQEFFSILLRWQSEKDEKDSNEKLENE